jgi:YidC/Oxa1 family membrane protein insertase
MSAQAATSRSRSILELLALFAIAYLLSEFALGWFLPSASEQASQPGIELSLVDDSVRQGNIVEVHLRNGGANPLVLPSRCPQPPLDVLERATATASGRLLVAESTAIPCGVEAISVAPNETATISLAPWKYSLLSEVGTFEVRVPSTVQTSGGTGSVLSAQLEVYEPGAFVKLFRTFITKPFLNLLVLVAAILPDHNLGIAIIVLTLLVKLLLFLPTQHALESQRRMQVIQPKVDQLRKKFADDPVRQQKEMMALWKEHKVNPFQSCLPLLVQFPVLIGLFYVIQGSSQLELSREFLYPFLQHVSWSFNPWFLGLDLTEVTWLAVPVLVGLQFWQMWLALKKSQAAQAKKVVLDAKTGKPEKQELSPEAMQQKIMLYAMPAMIGFFALQFPAAVSLYWAVSTLFAVGQQVVVNRKVAA